MKWFTDTVQLLIDNWLIVVGAVVVIAFAIKGNLGSLVDKMLEKFGILTPIGAVALAIAAIFIFKYDAVKSFFDPTAGPGRAIGASARADAKSYEYVVYPGQQTFPDPDGVGPAVAVTVSDPTLTGNPVFNTYALGVKANYQLALDETNMEVARVKTENSVEALRQQCLLAASATHPSCVAMTRLEELEATSKTETVKEAFQPVADYLATPIGYNWESHSDATDDMSAGNKGRSEVNRNKKVEFSVGFLLVIVLGLAVWPRPKS